MRTTRATDILTPTSLAALAVLQGKPYVLLAYRMPCLIGVAASFRHRHPLHAPKPPRSTMKIQLNTDGEHRDKVPGPGMPGPEEPARR